MGFTKLGLTAKILQGVGGCWLQHSDRNSTSGNSCCPWQERTLSAVRRPVRERPRPLSFRSCTAYLLNRHPSPQRVPRALVLTTDT